MATYLDVGALRIQPYIGRWPALAGRRGASALLSADALHAAVAATIAGRAEVNPAAGGADGVLSLLMADMVDPEPVAYVVLDILGRHCPAAQFEAVWGDGPSYVDAYVTTMKPRRDQGAVISTRPELAEFPLAVPCELCSVDPAVSKVYRGPDGYRACADCRARAEATDVAGRGAETRLLAEFPGMTRAEDFTDLAELSPGMKKNHLGTVSIDGNAVGQFFKKLADDHPAARKDVISAGIAAACFSALATATRAITDGAGSCLPVIPHVLGGDDVVVSVPAPHAMEFTRAYLEDFNRGTREVVAREVPAMVDEAPTASAGVVFAHARHPFATCLQVAGGMLRQAKCTFNGRESGVLWVDFTSEGEAPPPDRRPWTPSQLADLAADLTALSALPKSRQASLERASEQPVPAVALASVRRLVSRLGIDVARPFLASGDLMLLREALSLARWWQ